MSVENVMSQAAVDYAKSLEKERDNWIGECRKLHDRCLEYERIISGMKSLLQHIAYSTYEFMPPDKSETQASTPSRDCESAMPQGEPRVKVSEIPPVEARTATNFKINEADFRKVP